MRLSTLYIDFFFITTVAGSQWVESRKSARLSSHERVLVGDQNKILPTETSHFDLDSIFDDIDSFIDVRILGIKPPASGLPTEVATNYISAARKQSSEGSALKVPFTSIFSNTAKIFPRSTGTSLPEIHGSLFAD